MADTPEVKMLRLIALEIRSLNQTLRDALHPESRTKNTPYSENPYERKSND